MSHRFLPAPVLCILLLGAVAVFGQRDNVSGAQNRDRDASRMPQATARGSGAAIRFGRAEGLPRTRGAIRIATYNTLNLFDHLDDRGLSGEFDDIKMATPHSRCAKLADAIRAIDADIIALQEVESLEALTWFRDTWLKDAGYKHLASFDVGYYRGVECSIMSRFRITESKVWLDESLDNVRRSGLGWTAAPPASQPLKFQRSPLMVNIAAPGGYDLTVFSIHHKAGRDFNYQREAEAIRIMELVDAVRRAEPKRNIIVMGDFNAAPSDKSLRVYLESGMIDTLAHRVWQGDAPEMLLYKTHESNRVLDYILLNSAAHRELVIGSQFVFGTLAPPEGYDFNTDPQPEGYASDHYPVVIELTPHDQI
jgi:endonuclease/exonuclease/phosphatase family metal-dependent hydrolase